MFEEWEPPAVEPGTIAFWQDRPSVPMLALALPGLITATADGSKTADLLVLNRTGGVTSRPGARHVSDPRWAEKGPNGHVSEYPGGCWMFSPAEEARRAELDGLRRRIAKLEEGGAS